jgi:S1-C subfamily serine protease
MAVNGQAVSAPADVAAILSNSGRWIQLEIQRGGRAMVLRFRL